MCWNPLSIHFQPRMSLHFCISLKGSEWLAYPPNPSWKEVDMAPVPKPKEPGARHTISLFSRLSKTVETMETGPPHMKWPALLSRWLHSWTWRLEVANPFAIRLDPENPRQDFGLDMNKTALSPNHSPLKKKKSLLPGERLSWVQQSGLHIWEM